jgi:hypothetical protein
MEETEVWRGGPELKYCEFGHVRTSHVTNQQLPCNNMPLFLLFYYLVTFYSIVSFMWFLSCRSFPFTLPISPTRPVPEISGDLAHHWSRAHSQVCFGLGKKNKSQPLDRWLSRRIWFLFACIGVKGAFENSSEQV